MEAAAVQPARRRTESTQIAPASLDAHFRSFAQQVVPVLVKERIGILGMKPLGSGHILQTNRVTPIECLHYAMNLPTSTVITGIDKPEILDQAIEAVRTFRPLSAEAIAALLARTEPVAKTGRFEPFKTSSGFDGTAHHPEWLG